MLILRFAWRLVNIVPVPLTDKNFLNTISTFAHYFFYFILVLVTLSGWIYSTARGGPVSVFGLFDLPAIVEKNQEVAKLALNIHVISVYTFITLLALHIFASLYHHYFLKDKTLKRMWYGSSN